MITEGLMPLIPSRNVERCNLCGRGCMNVTYVDVRVNFKSSRARMLSHTSRVSAGTEGTPSTRLYPRVPVVVSLLCFLLVLPRLDSPWTVLLVSTFYAHSAPSMMRYSDGGGQRYQ